jgi:hypothetical protein
VPRDLIDEDTMDHLNDIAEWLLMAAGAVVLVGLIVYAALAFRLKHPPRD